MKKQTKMQNAASFTGSKQYGNDGTTVSTSDNINPLVYRRGDKLIIRDPIVLKPLDPFYRLCADLLIQKGDMIIEDPMISDKRGGE